jgi:hypothetical protein
MSSSYGENLMKKYGWNEGKGIGKNDQGIVNPIKASLKFDTAGVRIEIYIGNNWFDFFKIIGWF